MKLKSSISSLTSLLSVRLRNWLLIFILSTSLAGCEEHSQVSKLPASDDILSSYKRILIGEQTLFLPTLALLSSTNHSNLTKADGSQAPIAEVLTNSVDGRSYSQINLNLDAYRFLQDYSSDELVHAPNAICKRFIRQWERNLCSRGVFETGQSFGPKHFTVIDRARLSDPKTKLFTLGTSLDAGEAARELLVEGGKTGSKCVGDVQAACIAIISISKNVFAVWGTRKDMIETDATQITWLLQQYKYRIDGKN